ncbi:MAG: GntR family transcriptional regulator [Smithellaceae bacterium]|nr:GntR family transcriptional regulator [Smithellaceae bacterium]
MTTNQRVHEKVVTNLMRDIFSEKLKPGSKLPPERELSQQLNVDRTSLRVALKQLEAMNVLDIKRGDGIYVRDYLQNAGIDFFGLLLTKDSKDSEMIVNDFFVDEIWDFWTAVFPEILKMAAHRITARDVRAFAALIAEELEHLDDLERLIELEERQQDLVAQVANNMIFLLLSNSTRPMRRKIVEDYVHTADRETLKKFIEIKMDLTTEYMKETSSQAVADKTREILAQMHRQAKAQSSQKT